ncbi:MAG: SRPBCC domain-containing protein [Microvirga sp.]
MVSLRHAIKIDASHIDTFRALTSPEELSVWQRGTVTGVVAEGAISIVSPRRGLSFVWRTERIEPETCLVQTCLEGPEASSGRTLTITLLENGDGRTRLELTDDGWDAAHPHLALCNTEWGAALSRLRTHLEAKS